MKSRQFTFLALVGLLLVFAGFFAALSQEAEASGASLTVTARVVMPDLPTAVLDVSMPAQKNTASKVNIPLSVKVWDFNGEEDIENGTYVARFFNSGHAQIGEDVGLELKNSGEGEAGNGSNFMQLSGTAELSGPAKGYYYVFIYRNRTGDGGDEVLPFACSGEGTVDDCCSGTSLSSLYLYEDKNTLIPYSDDFFRPGCTGDWCCGCLCTDGNVKNRIYLKKSSSGGGGGGGGGGGLGRLEEPAPPPDLPPVPVPGQTLPEAESSGEESETGEPEGTGDVVSGEEEVTALLDGDKVLLLSSSECSCSVSIPDGAASPETEVRFRFLESENLPPAPEGQAFGSTCFEIEGVEGELTENALISVSYSEEDLELVGGDPEDLELAYWDEVKETWVVVPTEVDAKDNRLKTTTRHLGKWAVVSSGESKANSPAGQPGKPQSDSPTKNFIQSKVVTPIANACSSALNWLRGLFS